VLVLHDPVEGLDFPGGRIEVGEAKSGDVSSLEKSLKREISEETGLEVEVGSPFAVFYNEFPEGHVNAGKGVYLVGFKCRYISGESKLSHEHDNFKWVGKEDYKEVADGTSYFDVLEKYFNLTNFDKTL
jgi:8-oxo-dGTP diphosphatase